MKQEIFKFLDLVWLILEVWWYASFGLNKLIIISWFPTDAGILAVTQEQNELVRLELEGLPALTSAGLTNVMSPALRRMSLKECTSMSAQGGWGFFFKIDYGSLNELNLCHNELISENKKYISFFCHFSTLRWRRWLKSLMMKHNYSFILHIQYRGCWWPDNTVLQLSGCPINKCNP